MRLKLRCNDHFGIAERPWKDSPGSSADQHQDSPRAAHLLGAAAHGLAVDRGRRSPDSDILRVSTRRCEAISYDRASQERSVLPRPSHARLRSSRSDQAVALRAGGRAGERHREPSCPSIRCRPPSLTRREREIAELVAQGLSNKEIAETLVIAQRTAEGHVENILRKLSFTSRAQVAKAWSSRQRAGRP